MSLHEFIHTKIVPPIFMIIFTIAGQLLTLTGRDEPFTLASALNHSLGNAQAWVILFMYILWVLLSLKIPSRTVFGPASPSGFKPKYQCNGVPFFWSTLALFGSVLLLRPDLALEVHRNIPELFGAIHIVASLLCLWLLVKGKYFPEDAPEDGATTTGTVIFDFYRGVELHPTLFGVNVKQLVICRFGIMGWMLLSLTYHVAAIQLHGISHPLIVSACLQLMYTLKFFLYESTGYFDSIDTVHDRAGYYLIYGSMVWMPAFFGLHAYNYVNNPPEASLPLSLFYLILGLALIVLVYRIDYEKYFVRSSTVPNISLYGMPVEIIHAEYTDQTGRKQISKLVASGCWGLARHLNYLFEMIFYIILTAPGYSTGFIPLLLPAFTITFALHRLYRDEQKCKIKYGKYWQLYCSKVPYRLIPWIY